MAAPAHALPSFTERAMLIVAENKIRAAIEAGEFDNLPGMGKPSSIIDAPYDPFWWIRSKLEREQLTPGSPDDWR